MDFITGLPKVKDFGSITLRRERIGRLIFKPEESYSFKYTEVVDD